ncbi:MAG: glycine zipper 2TM domain-containing protein [Hylemonella sp.]|nr:glycine zipper 2TM domain-containing protein [Hylemonella sp.]
MKRFTVLAGALLSASLCAAQDEGLVISSTPVVRQVAVPRQVCSSEQVAVQPSRRGAGAVIGAVAGGIVGNAVGHGSGAATVLGAIGGAVIGDRIEDAPPTELHEVQRCSTQTFYENRNVGYEVEYEYADKRYKVQLPYDPGQTIALRVAPEHLGEPGAPPPQPIVRTPVYTPPVVVMQPPVYDLRPYPYYYYPPVGVQWHFGLRGGHSRHGHHRSHRHWRH